MTDQQINIAIAEHCGFNLEEYRMEEGGINVAALPDYCNDLNAMYEAENTLLGGPKFFSKGGKSTYIWNLKNVCAFGKNLNMDKNFYLMIHIPARQRAEAFLKTVGKWNDQ